MKLDQFNISQITLPPTLYKYRDWDNEKHKNILYQNNLYFSSIDGFNDPFDCRMEFNYKGAIVDQLYRKFKKQYEIDCIEKKDREIQEEAQNYANDLEHNEETSLNLSKDIELLNAQTLGICSFSSRKESILMWSHYSNCHTGFCVGYSTKILEKFFNNKNSQHDNKLFFLYKVNYPDQYPIKNYFEIEHPFDHHLHVVTNKYSDWKYEDEYRIILHESNDNTLQKEDRILEVPDVSIKEIILGCQMSGKDKEEILNVLKSKGYKIDLFQASKKRFSFSLEFEKIDY